MVYRLNEVFHELSILLDQQKIFHSIYICKVLYQNGLFV